MNCTYFNFVFSGSYAHVYDTVWILPDPKLWTEEFQQVKKECSKSKDIKTEDYFFKRSTVCCGKCQYETGCKLSECHKSEAQDKSVIDSWSFYVNRMTRLLPIYYATFIFGLPLISAGYSYFGPFDWHHNVGGALLAFFGLQSWVIGLGFGPNGKFLLCTQPF